MNRRTSLFAGILLAAPLLFGQEPQSQQNPGVPADVMATQKLVAWSWMQKPRPTPQPLPPPDKGIPEPDQQTGQPAQPANPAQQQAPANQTFTGKIVKTGDKYMLKVAGNATYQLDEQSGANRYEDKDVRILGTLDTATNTIHVVKIELLS